ncbi:dihydrolipoyl dehydrogenase [Natronobeatus ordinarius]|uniref:dihydrolipoyl dehydrogenase n=1 Tax=Natronobeatus ordinarius TaxID=2963433 RepID=UPI0020CFA4A0|nr:dihydrolipoyl dehydrogenase [Natronobeatus ordinarius]
MEEYDLVVLGGGSGSQVATAAAEADWDAAVVEPGPLGGACITRGCVPSKALVHRADVLEEIRRAGRFGIDAEVRDVDFGSITESVHETVYAKADRQRATLEGASNVTLYDGAGRFVDDRTIAVEDEDGTELGRLHGEHVVIAVGSRPTTPPIDGLETLEYLTSDDALFLKERPDELVIVGGGYIGAELGHVFDAFGTDVSIVGRSEVLLPREDRDVSRTVTAALEDRFAVYTGHEATAVEARGDGVAVTVEADDEATELTADEVLVAAGRTPNTDTLALEHTTIETDDRGYVETDAFLRTDAEDVWALGDVLGEEPYKHAADYEARCVSTNVLEDTQRTVDYDAMPHAIFTSPQVASVGRTEAELEDEGLEFESTTVPYDAAPLGLLLEEPESLVKVLAGSDGEILGCHVVGQEASTLIHEVVVVMGRGGRTVDDVADTVHVHPALSEVLLTAFDELSTRPYSTAPDWRETAEE